MEIRCFKLKYLFQILHGCGTSCLDIYGLFGTREEGEREIWTRKVAEKCFVSSVWSMREIETTD